MPETADAFLTVSDLQPPVQTGFRDPEGLGDLSLGLVALAGDCDHVATRPWAANALQRLIVPLSRARSKLKEQSTNTESQHTDYGQPACWRPVPSDRGHQRAEKEKYARDGRCCAIHSPAQGGQMAA